MKNSPSQIEWKRSQEPVEYPAAVAAMEQRVADIIAGTAPEMVWLLEHPSLYTSGTSANAFDLVDKNRFPVYAAGRGGQYTYHGPGQRISYVMMDLKKRALPAGPDLRAYVQQLEQWVINSLAYFGVQGSIREGRVGVWTSDKHGHEAKIAALGIRVRKWVTFHGVSLNVHPDLSHYAGIIPCGIRQFGVTSLQDLGIKVTMDEVDEVLRNQFGTMFPED